MSTTEERGAGPGLVGMEQFSDAVRTPEFSNPAPSFIYSVVWTRSHLTSLGLYLSDLPPTFLLPSILPAPFSLGL